MTRNGISDEAVDRDYEPRRFVPPLGWPMHWRKETVTPADRPPLIGWNRYPRQCIGICFRLPGEHTIDGRTHHKALSIMWAKPARWWRVTDRSCAHESCSGNEGPVRDLGSRHVVRWRCDACDAIVYSDAALSALRAEVVRLRAALERVRVLHSEQSNEWFQPGDTQSPNYGPTECAFDFRRYPCPTVAALADAGQP